MVGVACSSKSVVDKCRTPAHTRTLTELLSLVRDARYVSTSGSCALDFLELFDARIEESANQYNEKWFLFFFLN